MITTERLHLRPWGLTDLPAMHRMNADPRVMAHFPATLTEAESKAFIERLMAAQHEHGYSYFAAEERNSANVIGFIGMAYQDYEAPFNPATDIGWRLMPEYWGKGYATEGARACLDFAFEALGLSEVVAVAVAQNTPSLRVMQRIGMKEAGWFKHPKLKDNPELEECFLYRITKDEHLRPETTQAGGPHLI